MKASLQNGGAYRKVNDKSQSGKAHHKKDSTSVKVRYRLKEALKKELADEA